MPNGPQYNTYWRRHISYWPFQNVSKCLDVFCKIVQLTFSVIPWIEFYFSPTGQKKVKSAFSRPFCKGHKLRPNSSSGHCKLSFAPSNASRVCTFLVTTTSKRGLFLIFMGWYNKKYSTQKEAQNVQLVEVSNERFDIQMKKTWTIIVGKGHLCR